MFKFFLLCVLLSHAALSVHGALFRPVARRANSIARDQQKFISCIEDLADDYDAIDLDSFVTTLDSVSDSGYESGSESSALSSVSASGSNSVSISVFSNDENFYGADENDKENCLPPRHFSSTEPVFHDRTERRSNSNEQIFVNVPVTVPTATSSSTQQINQFSRGQKTFPYVGYFPAYPRPNHSSNTATFWALTYPTYDKEEFKNAI